MAVSPFDEGEILVEVRYWSEKDNKESVMVGVVYLEEGFYEAKEAVPLEMDVINLKRPLRQAEWHPSHPGFILGLTEEEFYLITTNPELEFDYPKRYPFRDIKREMGKVVGFGFWRGVTGAQKYLLPVLAENGEVHTLLCVLGEPEGATLDEVEFLTGEGLGEGQWFRFGYYGSVGKAGEGPGDWTSLQTFTTSQPHSLCFIACSRSKSTHASKSITTHLAYCPPPCHPILPFLTLKQ